MKCNAQLKRKFISIFDAVNGRLKVKRGPGDYRATDLEHGNDLPQIFRDERTNEINRWYEISKKESQSAERSAEQ